MVSMKVRRDGVFEGHINVRGRSLLPARMRPSEDRTELVFVVDWYSRHGRTEKVLTARRVGTER